MAEKSKTSIPFWRDIRKLNVLIQIVFVILVIIAGFVLVNNMQTSLDQLGKTFGFEFFQDQSSFAIPPESLEFDRTDPYWYAIVVGLVNTVKVALIGIILATILGTFMGIARLSSNWLISKIAEIYVEIIRNIPLLVQLIFWYFAVFVNLPDARFSIEFFGVFLSNRGLFLPWAFPSETFSIWAIYLGVALIIAIIAYIYRRNQLKRAERPGFPGFTAMGVFMVLAAMTWFFTGPAPLNLEFPVFGRFNFDGGIVLSTEFSALLFGLVIYTGAFISELVRAGIQAVAKGQVEAAKALGLKGSKVLQLVVLPQALRVIVPPLTSQYLNLTKNSSLAVAIGYFDVTRVANTTINQTGHGLEVIIILMACYLTLSLLISMVMNAYNRRIKLVER